MAFQLKYTCNVETHLGNIPDIAMNVGKISQVITNLLINAGQAIESTGQHGTITITTETVGEFVKLYVKDTGCGIQPCHLDKLFNPFFTTNRANGGTGLGLNVTYNIIYFLASLLLQNYQRLSKHCGHISNSFVVHIWKILYFN